MSVQLYFKTPRLRLVYDSARRVTVLIRRGTEQLLGEVAGHPMQPQTHAELANLLGLTPDEKRDLRGARPLAPSNWRPAA